jgi:hypothetical protein
MYTTKIIYSDTLERIYVSGESTPEGTNRSFIYVEGLFDDGRRDASFGANGIAVIDFLALPHDNPVALAFQGEKLLVAGEGNDTTAPVPLARLLVDTSAKDEPCHNGNTCDASLSCVAEQPHGLRYHVCRAASTPPPAHHEGGHGEQCHPQGSASRCDEYEDGCTWDGYCQLRVAGVTSDCGGNCTACTFGLCTAIAGQAPVGDVTCVRVRTSSCHLVSNPNFTADGAGESFMEAEQAAKASLAGQVCLGSDTGCCDTATEEIDCADFH